MDDGGFRSHVNDVYVQHNQQTDETRAELKKKWSDRAILGEVDVWDLVPIPGNIARDPKTGTFSLTADVVGGGGSRMFELEAATDV